MAHTAGSGGTNSWTRNYQYSGTNNRLAATSVPGSPLSVTETYDYDLHGSMLTMPHLPGGLTWDYADRLKAANKGGGGIVYFTYDGAGQRVRKVWEHGTVEERVYLGGYEIYRKHTGSITGTVELERETVHVMDDQRRVAMAETKTVDTSGGATGVGVTRWRFQLDNHLGSAMLELDQTGNVISYEEYHPYGSSAFHAADGAVEVSAKRYRYTGKERDEETGLYYHGARYYAPWLGRWTAADPLGIAQPGGPDLNLYAYVRSRPMVSNDLSGLQERNPTEGQTSSQGGRSGVGPEDHRRTEREGQRGAPSGPPPEPKTGPKPQPKAKPSPPKVVEIEEVTIVGRVRKDPTALTTSKEGLDFIKARENAGTVVLSEIDLTPRLDSAGNLQIGHSELLCIAGNDPCFAEKRAEFAVGITREQAHERFLNRSIRPIERAIREQVKVPLSQGEFDALVSIGFNGTGKRDFQEAVRLVNEEKRAEAAKAILNTDLLRFGLGRRRFAEAVLFKTGTMLSFQDTINVKVSGGPGGTRVEAPKGSRAEEALILFRAQ
jgi:RHS repeat-associated protein